jgi:hypothetical protein
MPSEKSVERGRGRPHGVKDRRPRRFKPRLIVPVEQQVLSKREAAAVAGIGLSKIDQNLKAIGAVRSGSRILIFRDRLMAWVQSLPPAVPPPSLPRSRWCAMTVVKGVPVAASGISELIEAGAPELAASSADRAPSGDGQIDTATAGSSDGKCHAVNAEGGKTHNKIPSRADRLQKLERDHKLNNAVVTAPAKKMRG